MSQRHAAAALERAGGLVLIAGLALLGFALPVAQHVRQMPGHAGADVRTTANACPGADGAGKPVSAQASAS